MRPKNPYAPDAERPLHEGFEAGVNATERQYLERSDRPQYPTATQSQFRAENAACTRASAKTMIGIRISQLQAEIDGLRSIAKFAEAMENTPADEYLWKLIVGQRTV